jgi:DNA-binding transcriptional LysR family regulator
MLEVMADARAFDLSRREADLALRMGRPLSSGLVTRRLSAVAFAFYAATNTEAGSRGAVDFRADPFLGEEGGGHNALERWLDELAPERRVVHRCNSTTALLAAAQHGVGVAPLPCYIGDAEPALRRLDGPEPHSQEIWLLVHGDLRRTPRVRAVIDWVDETIERAGPALRGERRGQAGHDERSVPGTLASTPRNR